VSTPKIRTRLAFLEARIRMTLPTAEQLKKLILASPAEVLLHVIPRVSRKIEPDSPPTICPFCGDSGLPSNGSITCSSVLEAESQMRQGETRLRELERAVDRASSQLILEAIDLAQQELEGDPEFRDFFMSACEREDELSHMDSASVKLAPEK
jgi:hypothetical protein